MKPGNAPLQSIRLLDQMRERIRYMHYSLSTEKNYLYWVKFFVRWHGGNGVMRHPREMAWPEIEAFLAMLANERKVSTSTHNQALSAVLFLYREVLGIDLPWLDGINRPANNRRIPSVLTRHCRLILTATMNANRYVPTRKASVCMQPCAATPTSD